MKLSLLLLPLLILMGSYPDAKSVINTKGLSAVSLVSYQGVFSYLRGHRQNTNIVINWGVISITDVSHFIVYHSDDNDLFVKIAEVPAGNTFRYSFKDLSVFPGYHYYKIVCVFNNSTTVESDVEAVRIVRRV